MQDADRLDAIGAVGILRVAAFSGAKGRLLVSPTSGEADSAEGHFHDKLLKVRDRMKVSQAQMIWIMISVSRIVWIVCNAEGVFDPLDTVWQRRSRKTTSDGKWLLHPAWPVQIDPSEADPSH